MKTQKKTKSESISINRGAEKYRFYSLLFALDQLGRGRDRLIVVFISFYSLFFIDRHANHPTPPNQVEGSPLRGPFHKDQRGGASSGGRWQVAGGGDGGGDLTAISPW